jgi:hypothetical protein
MLIVSAVINDGYSHPAYAVTNAVAQVASMTSALAFQRTSASSRRKASIPMTKRVAIT